MIILVLLSGNTYQSLFYPDIYYLHEIMKQSRNHHIFGNPILNTLLMISDLLLNFLALAPKSQSLGHSYLKKFLSLVKRSDELKTSFIYFSTPPHLLNLQSTTVFHSNYLFFPKDSLKEFRYWYINILISVFHRHRILWKWEANAFMLKSVKKIDQNNCLAVRHNLLEENMGKTSKIPLYDCLVVRI